MEVEMISVETIKPSSPTQSHLKTFKISLIDGFFARFYTPFITYYADVKDYDAFSGDRLKRSLAKTLTRFYPLAGRVDMANNTIDCNGNGVLFSTVYVKCELADILKDPKIEEFYKFMAPMPPICPDEPAGGMPALIGIQLNQFKCGGIAISVFMSHLICDAISISAFMKCWSEFSLGKRDSEVDVFPLFPGTDLFPRCEESIASASSYILDRSLNKEGKGVIRRFVFEKRAIDELRERARSEDVPKPTRVEAVSMFIWKHCMLASEEVWGEPRASLYTFTVDLRRRMVPPLSEYSVGNIIWKIMIHRKADDNADISQLVTSFRTTMNTFGKVIGKIEKNDGQEAVLEYIDELGKFCRDTNLNPYNMTSWCRMGFTEVDFGWGKPVWFSGVGGNNVASQYKNSITLIDRDGGDKIELWLILDHREMIVLEDDLKFLKFASLNPSVT
jgi:hypothetical protein